uniref:Uncharacterized protein n=1 Tax=Panagrolaimus davidi TaxID=227884 RepID=A0A914PGP9_9BILA
MNEYQNTGSMDVIKKCIHILHKNAEAYCQHASQCRLRTLTIDNINYDSIKVPFVNYCHIKTLKKFNFTMIPEIIESVFASMVNASF